MDHRQYIGQYRSADVDGEMSPAERQASHWSSCAACRQRQGDEGGIPELRQKVIAAPDREEARRTFADARWRRPRRWSGGPGATVAAAAMALVVLIGGSGRRSGNPLESVANDYLSAQRAFASNSALSTKAALATALAREFGHPLMWDFSSLGLSLAGARIERRPDGRVIIYSLYKGKGGSILCINARRLNYAVPPGGKEFHGVPFYQYRGLWIGIVHDGSVFCYFVTRMSPNQLLPALVHDPPPA